MSYFLCVIGMVLVVEGLPYMTFPQAVKRTLLKLVEVPDQVLRLLGGLAVAAGLVLVYFGNR
jgi:uncharacterized protein YjeT (DUF2065 family)